jgi:hypothetical protein
MIGFALEYKDLAADIGVPISEPDVGWRQTLWFHNPQGDISFRFK